MMNLASLHSGGKDSTYSAFLAKCQGHDIRCLLTVSPKSEESRLLHHPNTAWTRLQSKSMNIPQIVLHVDSDDVTEQEAALEKILLRAKKKYGVNGLVHGGISSRFQKSAFDSVCARCGIRTLSPLWNADPAAYMNDLLDSGFEYVVVGVSSGGLDESWLGRTITRDDLRVLTNLSARHGFNMNFEGGEAETFVTNCPMFSSPIRIRGSAFWDGYRGRFEISDAVLVSDA